jgi:sarcosine oxidase, subunit beta
VLVDTAIIGGGIAGTCLAYYLAEMGVDGIAVLERDTLGSGSTAGSFGGVRQQFSTPLEVELGVRGLEFWRTAETVFGWPCPFYEDGYLFATADPAVADKLKAAADVQRHAGATSVEILDSRELSEVIPWLDCHDLLAGSWTPHDGRVTPTDGINALSHAASLLGVTFHEHWKVTSIERTPRGVELVGAGEIRARRVVISAGIWTPPLVQPLGIELDIRGYPLHYALTEPVFEGMRVPLTVDLDTGFCVEREQSGVVATVLVEDPTPDYTADEMLEALTELARMRAPALATVGIRKVLSAWVDGGGDGHPYAGAIEDDVWVLAGFGGHGITHGPPVARLLALAMVGKSDPTLDIGFLDPRRQPATSAESEWLVGDKMGRRREARR